jgi:hypothetical protein
VQGIAGLQLFLCLFSVNVYGLLQQNAPLMIHAHASNTLEIPPASQSYLTIGRRQVGNFCAIVYTFFRLPPGP